MVSKHCFNGVFCYKSHDAKHRKPTFQRKYLHLKNSIIHEGNTKEMNV